MPRVDADAGAVIVDAHVPRGDGAPSGATGWLVGVRGPEDASVRAARLATLPDSWLLSALVGAWSIGAPVYALTSGVRWWLVVWLVASVLVQAVHQPLVLACRRSARRFTAAPHAALVRSGLVGTLVLALGVGGLGASDEPRLMASAVVVTLTFMSYEASRHAAFPRLSTIAVCLLAAGLGGGLLTSPTMWLTGALAPTYPVFFVAMLGQNHRIVCAALQAQHDNWRLSMHDPLTGLPNRLQIEEWMTARVGRSAARGTTAAFAVMCLDLDGFKPVNDAHGHPVGDALLQVVASRLASCVRLGDLVSRTGGDEFVVLVGDAGPERAALMADRLIEACSQPFDLGGGCVVEIGVSVGVALYPGDREDAHDPDDLAVLLSRADAALYESKHTLRGSWTLHA